MNLFGNDKLQREALEELKHVCETNVKIANTLDLIRLRLERLDGRVMRIDNLLPHQETPTEEP